MLEIKKGNLLEAKENKNFWYKVVSDIDKEGAFVVVAICVITGIRQADYTCRVRENNFVKVIR